MEVGTKSLLFGVHQFIWHPITVYRAWKELYGKPTWGELICIIIHDWGYWGKPNMDGPEGENHPIWSAMWAFKHLDRYHQTKYHYWLCLLHSRHTARTMRKEPSRLCYADKLSFKYDPWWFYLPRAWLSGELFEYRKNAIKNGFITSMASHREWHRWAYKIMVTVGEKQKADAMPYAN